jgi:hypothetical protein
MRWSLIMNDTLKNFGLVLGGALVLAFVVSFALGLRSPSVTTRAADPQRIVPGVFSGRRVEVLNAAGIAGLARQATETLRAAGYDVVFFGNASRLAEPGSRVLDRVGKPELARAVAERLRISRVETRLDSTRLVEVSVILGKDWLTDDSIPRPR